MRFSQQKNTARDGTPQSASEDLAYLVDKALPGEHRKPVERYTEFAIDEQTGEVLAKIIDGNNGEVVREITPSELTRIANALDIYQGLLVEQRL